MFPVRSVVALGESYASEHEMLMANDSTYVSTYQSYPQQGVRRKSDAQSNIPPLPDQYHPFSLWYENYNPAMEAVALVRDAALKRVGRTILYKGYSIEAKLSDGNRIIKFYLFKDGRQIGIYETMHDAKWAVDEPVAREQKKEVQSWSDARVSANAITRGLPSLDLLRDVDNIQVQPLKGPITTALEQGKPVEALEVFKAGQQQEVQEAQQTKKSMLIPILIGGAALAAVTLAK